MKFKMLAPNIIPLLFMVNNSIFNKDDDEYENDDNTNDKEQVSSCYIGTDMAAWNTSINAIFKANIDLYPKIFCGSSDKL